MTVTYNYDLSKINMATVAKILWKWKGSVFKVLLGESLLYFGAYATMGLIYNFWMHEEAKKTFEVLVTYCRQYISMIPVTFILGFYVQIVFQRWSGILNGIPWPDTPCLLISTFMNGKDAKSRLYRRTIARYMIASEMLTFRDISMQIRKRFPTTKHFIDSGLLTTEEVASIDSLESASGDNKYWMPIQWAMCLLEQARSESLISSDYLFGLACMEVNKFRMGLVTLIIYDWVNIPLVYTQIVTIAVWSYFASSLISNQFIRSDVGKEDIYVPFFTIFQFVCLVGWLRVAHNMLNPLGEADDDFELNWVIDRNLKVAMRMMDDNCGALPDLTLDSFSIDGHELPYTAASNRGQAMRSTCTDVEVSDGDSVLLEAIAPMKSSFKASNGSRMNGSSGTVGQRPRARSWNQFGRTTLTRRSWNGLGTTSSSPPSVVEEAEQPSVKYTIQSHQLDPNSQSSQSVVEPKLSVVMEEAVSLGGPFNKGSNTDSSSDETPPNPSDQI